MMPSQPLLKDEEKWQPVAGSLKTQLEALDSNPLTTRNTQWLDSIVAIQKKALERVGGEKEQHKIAGDDLASIWLTLFETIGEITPQSALYYNIVQAFLFYHSDLGALGHQANTMQSALQRHLEDKNLENLNPPSAPKGLSFARTDLWNMLFFLNASVTIDNQGTITPAYPEKKVVTKFVSTLTKEQATQLKNALQLKKPSKRIEFAQLIVNNKTDFLQKVTQYANKSDFFSCLFFNSITWGHTGTEAKQDQPTLQWPSEQTLGTIDQLDKRLTQREKRKLADKIQTILEKEKLLTDALTWAQRNDALKKAYGIGAIITCLLAAATLTLDSSPGIFFPNKITIDSITQYTSTLSPITTGCLGLSGFLLGVYLGYRHGKKAGAVACVGAIGLTAIPLLNDIGFADFLPTASALAIAQIGIIVVASVALWAEKGGTPQTHSFD
jgi:hypothetical protein